MSPFSPLLGSLVILLVLTAILISGWPLVAPGHPSSVDVWPHLSRQKIVYESLRQGFSPYWSFTFYSGYPHLRFYSPLFYLLSGALTVLTRGNLLAALKLLLVLLHFGSAWAMYAYLKHRTGDNWGAALGALVYAVVPWRARHIANLANYPQAPIYLLLPLMFLVLDRLIVKPERRSALLLGLLAALALLAHVIYGLFALVFLGVALALGYGRAALRARTLKLLAVAALFTIGLAAFFLIPFALEYRSHVYPKLIMTVPAPDPLVALGLRSRLGGFVGGYLGLSVIGLLAAATWAIFRVAADLRRILVPMLINLLASLLLAFVAPMMGASGFLLNAGLLPERFLLFFLFFAGVLIAGAWPFLKSRPRIARTGPMLILLIVVLVVGLDCLRSHVEIKFPRTEDVLAGHAEIYDSILGQRPSKVLDVCVPLDKNDDPARCCTYPAMNFIYGDLPTPLGPHYHQFAPRSMLYAYPWINQIAADLADAETPSIRLPSLRALNLLGVSHVIMIPPADPAGDEHSLLIKPGLNWDTRLLAGREPIRLVYGATGADLVLASNRLKPMPQEQIVQDLSFFIADDWEELLDSVRIDQRYNQVNFIPVPATQAAESLPEPPSLQVLDRQIRNQDVSLRLQVDCDCFLRIAISYYPELRVLIDGRPAGFRETKDHFVYLPLPAGHHTVQITAPLTPLRRWSLAFSGLALVLGLIAWFALPTRHPQIPEPLMHANERGSEETT
jgi:hypothetical protein